MKQYKGLDSQIKDVDSKGRILVAANALGNIDADKDISMEGSFVKTLKDNFARLKWFLNHDRGLLVGVPIEGKEKYPYLEMLGQVNMNKQLGRDVYEDYKLYAEYGRTLEHSIGVEAIKKTEKDGIRRVHEWKLWEYSTLTAWGANENTPMLGMKSMEDVNSAIDWLDLKMRKGNFSDEKFLEIEKQLSLLRSLCTEPDREDDTTQKAKPNDEAEQREAISVIQSFCLTLKDSTSGIKRAVGAT